MDVFSLSGKHVETFSLQKLIHEKIDTDIKLTSLDFITIPVLKWTGRRNRLPQAFGKQHQVFDAPKVILVGQVLI